MADDAPPNGTESLKDWVVRREIRADDTPAIARRLPPVVVAVNVPTGSVNVPAGRCDLEVTFSEPMMDEAWSVVEFAPGSAPNLLAPPRLSADRRRLILALDLQPSRLYAFWLNEGAHLNFRDDSGAALVPYLVGFQTGN